VREIVEAANPGTLQGIAGELGAVGDGDARAASATIKG
jgi:hypothetical protein